MPTRFNKKGLTNFGTSPLPSGYNGRQSPTLNVPPVGLEDADRALFNLFEKEIPFQVNIQDGTKKVPIIFASGEKWALLKKGPQRDRNGTLVLPLIVIGRTNITQASGDDIVGRGINQQTGELTIRRRLEQSDRGYQGLINRYFLQNQANVAVSPNDEHLSDQLTTNRTLGDLQDDPTIFRGGLLKQDRRKNVWETIVVPAPQFYTATYEIIVWTNYIQHMNQIVETLISSFLPQGNQWRIDTEKGYWFVATVDGNLYNAQNNFDDMSTEERTIKYQFNVKVPGYILASDSPGTLVPVRRYVSSPDVVFSTKTGDGLDDTLGLGDPFLGSDDPTLPLTNEQSNAASQRREGKTRLYPGNTRNNPQDPAYDSQGRSSKRSNYKRVVTVDGKGRQTTKFVKVKTTNAFSGETVFSSTDLDNFSIVVMDD